MVELLAGTKVEFEQDGSKKIVQAGEIEIGVFRRNGTYVAYKNICNHQGGPICEGMIIGKVEPIVAEDKSVLGETFSKEIMHIVCPWHGYEYNLDTGECVGDKRFRLKSYEVVERGDELYVVL